MKLYSVDTELDTSILNFNDVICIFKNKKVALIGNSLSLFNKQYATEIDNYDVVCRINQGVKACNAVSHGLKTDVIFYSKPNIIKDLKIQKNTKLILTSLKRGKNVRFNNDTFFYDPTFWKEVHYCLNLNKFTQEPSTGCLAYSLILKCSPLVLSIYGFDFKQTPTYYHLTKEWQEKHPLGSSDTHNFEKEKEYFIQLSKDYSYVFLKE